MSGANGQLSDSGEFQQEDDSEDEFEMSSNSPGGGGKSQAVANAPFDEAMELSDEGSPQGRQGGGKNQTVQNAPFDEAMELSDDDDGGGGGDDAVVKNQQFDEEFELSSEESVDNEPDSKQNTAQSMGASSTGGMGGETGHNATMNFGNTAQSGGPGDDDESSSEDDDDDDNDGTGGIMGGGAAGGAGGAGGEDYSNLQVSGDIKELFQYIGRYKPHSIELETKLRPFIPDFIPAVGDINPFLKVERPDGKPDNLGLSLLDEPTSEPSDPAVLYMQLRHLSKQLNMGDAMVRSLEHAQSNPKEIDRWMKNISDLHRNKPPPSVQYAKRMPDIDALMQIWPQQMEDVMDEVALPSAEMDLELREYVKVVCAMLDIPVHKNLTESLHVLFTLYSDFKANVNFQQEFGASGGPESFAGAGGGRGVGSDVLQLGN